MVREFEQPSTSTVMAVADLSGLTRCRRGRRADCGAGGTGSGDPRLVRGLLPGPLRPGDLDEGFSNLGVILRPRTARRGTSSIASTPISFSRASAAQAGREHQRDDWRLTWPYPLPAGHFRFLFDDFQSVLREFALLNAVRRRFLVLVDGAFAFEMAQVSTGWIETVDVENWPDARTISRRALGQWRRACAMAGRRQEPRARARPRRRDGQPGLGGIRHRAERVRRERRRGRPRRKRS